jgi:hypothetical protein
MQNPRKGAFVRVGDEYIEFVVQTYVYDVIFISQEPGGVYGQG